MFCNFLSVKICNQPYQISPNFYTSNKNKQTVKKTVPYLMGDTQFEAGGIKWSTKTPLTDENNPIGPSFTPIEL